MAATPKPPPVTVSDLASAPADPIDRLDLFRRYSKQKPTPDAIPVLRRALGDSFHAVVKCAAVSLRKLGPVAREAMTDLLAAAAFIDESTDMPQAYPDCVEAMAAIDPHHPELLPLIKHFIGLDNWVPISASMRALKTIGSPESKDQMQSMATFWMPELNKMQRRVIEELLAEGEPGQKGQ